jgi:acyl-CoA thioesterase FadM
MWWVAAPGRYAETDQMGIAYYANYLIWFEVGRSEFCRQRTSVMLPEGLGYKLVSPRFNADTETRLGTMN